MSASFDRAHAAARASGLAVFGGIVLNHHAGGIHPAAVAAGGRVVEPALRTVLALVAEADAVLATGT